MNDAAPNPPPRYILKPRTPSRMVGTSPTSAILTKPCSEQHAKLNLNFRGKFWHRGFLKKNFAIAFAYMVTSKGSLEHTPAKWLHITFLMVLPQASLDVRPPSARPLTTSLTSSNCTQCN